MPVDMPMINQVPVEETAATPAMTLWAFR
jgi:hypothetical protein